MGKDDLLEIGEVVRPHGLKGRIKAKSYLVSKGSVQGLEEVFLRKSKEPAVRFRIKTLHVERKALLLEIEGIEDVEAAARLVGCRILISPDKLEKLPEDEYYWYELLGLRVTTEAGQSLGRIESIVPGANHDIYVCAGNEGEIFLPAIGDVIRKIDIDAGVMVVRLLEGL
ncbi:MAG: 16S rRNA processing protein RimM [Syntrophus sp. (in: bacteria)]|nr:16S rRNA processing protein RimM [Syntrophus sp. (in: bacteria)]